jgi:hypothetical protein
MRKNIVVLKVVNYNSTRSIDVISSAKYWNNVKNSQFNNELQVVLPFDVQYLPWVLRT